MKAVILCDGDIPEKSIISRDLEQADLFIAADGGANHARTLQLQPDLIIGDLDSYEVTGDENSEIISDPDQETNDLEKALSYALNCEAKDAVVFGATGKRLDHTLKNLSVLLQFDSRFESIRFKDNYSTIRLIHSPFRQQFDVGTSVSLFPLSGVVKELKTRGLKYPLHRENLENGIRDGTSNVTTETEVEIEFEEGDLLLLVNHLKTP
jgi:thiamine pyrophosphokinase